jgi:hypothetical protein
MLRPEGGEVIQPGLARQWGAGRRRPGKARLSFKNYLPPERYHAMVVEPNPNCIKSLEQQFGLVEDDRGAMTQGASLVADHNSGDYQANQEAAGVGVTIWI